MAALHDRRARLLASLYATYGEAATWTSAEGGQPFPIMVRRRQGEDALSFGQSEISATSEVFRVRKSEVAEAMMDATFTLTEADESFRLLADARQADFGMEWICEAVAR